MKIYGMSLVWAGFISLDSTFNNSFEQQALTQRMFLSSSNQRRSVCQKSSKVIDHLKKKYSVKNVTTAKKRN
jgi:hypothetical protein